jgi:hypothetical protein
MFRGVARAPSEEPKGLVYQPELLSAEEEERLRDRLLPVRARAAELAGHGPEELVEILVQRYSITFRTLRGEKAA